MDRIPLPGKHAVLHQGARTLVYTATGPSGEGWVVKTPAQAIPSEDSLAALRKEARLLESMAGPGFPAFVELITSRSTVQLVVADTGARSLDRHSLPLSIDEAVQVIDEAAAALGRVHDEGLVHGDVHPGNLCWASEAGSLLLIDFGHASAPLDPGRVAGGGTLRTLSPEQSGRTGLGVDRRADLYSLGAVAFELLTGQALFDEGDPLSLVHAHLARQPRSAQQLRPDVPDDIAAMVLRLVEKDPERRYQSVAGLRSDLARWRAGRRHFELGSEDARPQFTVPRRLFGRERELHRIRELMAQVEAGERRVITLEGAAGIGKSALATAALTEARSRGWLAARGGFEVQRHEQPIEAIREACHALIGQVPDDDVDAIRVGVDDHAPALARALPATTVLLGPQPSPPPVGPRQAAARTRQAVVRFISSVARPGRPLLLVLEDLQWGQEALASLIEAIASDQRGGDICLVLAMRDDELDDSHPMARLLRSLSEHDPPAERIRLSPLDDDAALGLVSQALHQDPEDSRPLADALRVATGGNPLALHAQLADLADNGLIIRDGGGWTWLPEAFDELALAEEVVDLLLLRLNRLGRDAYRAIEAAAIVGQRFELGILSKVLDWPPGRLIAAIEIAVDHGLIASNDDAWTAARRADRVGLPARQPGVWLSFSHSRVVEAASAEVEHDDAVGLHLRAGRLAMALADGDPWLEADAVGHLRHALHRLADDTERLKVADLALRVADHATSTGSTGKALAALDVADAAVGWRDPDRWERIATMAAEVAAAGDRPAELDAWTDRLQQRARSLAVTAPAACATIAWATRTQRYDRAIDTSRAFLEAAGLSLADGFRPLHFLRAVARFLWAWRGRPLRELVARPEPADPLIRAVARVHTASAIPHSATTPAGVPEELFSNCAWLLEHGPIPEGAIGYTGPAVFFTHILGRPHLGFRFGQVATEVSRRPGGERSRGQIAAIFSTILAPMVLPLDQAQTRLLRDARGALALGDTSAAGVMLVQHAMGALLLGEALADVDAVALDHLQLLRQHRVHRATGVLERLRTMVAELRDPSATPSPATPSPADTFITETADASVDHVTWALAQIHHCFMDPGPEARAALVRRPPSHPRYPARLPVVMFGRACRAVMACELASSGHLSRREATAFVREARKHLGLWDKADEPRGWWVEWVEGAHALSRGRARQARRILLSATEGALRAGARHVAAHAAELAAGATSSTGDEADMVDCLRQAHALYRQWGARTRVARLERDHAFLRPTDTAWTGLSSSSSHHLTAILTDPTVTLRHGADDGTTPDAMLELACRLAGATWGAVLVRSDDGWRHSVTAWGEERPVATSVTRRAMSDPSPWTVDDIEHSPRHAADPALRDAGVRALLATPVQPGRVLLLVNDLLPGAFSTDVLAALQPIILEMGPVAGTDHPTPTTARLG